MMKHAVSCIQECQLDTLKDILNTTSLNQYQMTRLLMEACLFGHLVIVRFLLTSQDIHVRPTMNNWDNPPIVWAAKGGHWNIVRYLLTSPELTEHACLTPDVIMHACHKDTIEEFQWLTNASSFPSAYDIYTMDDYIFKLICHENSVRILQYVLEQPSFIQQREDLLLGGYIQAIKRNHSDCIMCFLKSSAISYIVRNSLFSVDWILESKKEHLVHAMINGLVTHEPLLWCEYRDRIEHQYPHLTCISVENSDETHLFI